MIDAIKQKILETGLFNDNIFLDRYCELIIAEKNKKNKKSYNTHIHHIIPRCFFKLIKSNVDETSSNKVVLSISNHIFAHYYLCKCCKENTKLYFLLLCALNMLTNKKDKLKNLLYDFDDVNLDEIEKLNIEKNKLMSIRQKGNKHALGQKLSDEVKEKMRKNRIGKQLSNETKNRISNRVLNTCWINKDNQYKRVQPETLDSFLQEGWKLGGKPISDEQKEKISLKNTGAKRTIEQRKKMSQKARNREVWNKGISCSDTAKLKISETKRAQKKHWYTNGKENVFSENCPQGFNPGRTISDETRKKCGAKNIGKIPWNKK